MQISLRNLFTRRGRGAEAQRQAAEAVADDAGMLAEHDAVIGEAIASRDSDAEIEAGLAADGLWPAHLPQTQQAAEADCDDGYPWSGPQAQAEIMEHDLTTGSDYYGMTAAEIAAERKAEADIDPLDAAAIFLYPCPAADTEAAASLQARMAGRRAEMDAEAEAAQRERLSGAWGPKAQAEAEEAESRGASVDEAGREAELDEIGADGTVTAAYYAGWGPTFEADAEASLAEDAARDADAEVGGLRAIEVDIDERPF